MRLRLTYIDNLKAFAITLVVLGHIIQNFDSSYDQNHLFRYIYSFHMPLFMAISGFCCSVNDKIKDIVTKRFFQLIIPFFAWALISQYLGGPSIIKVLISPINGLWFLYALFFINVLFVGSYKLSVRNNLNFLWISAIGVFLLFVTGLIFREKFGLGDIAWHYPFYWGGYYLKKHQYLLNKKVLTVSSLLLWLVMGWFWMRITSPSFFLDVNIHSKGVMYLWKFSTALVGLFTFISLFKLYTNTIHIKFLYLLGTNTLGIYAVHFHVIKILSNIIGQSFTYTTLFVVIALIVVIGFSCMLVWLFKRNSYIATVLIGYPFRK